MVVGICHDRGVRTRVLVVSHACVIEANQSVYTDLANDHDVEVVVPAVWRDDLRPTPYGGTRQSGSGLSLLPVGVVGVGRPQRHVHLCSPRRVLERRNPHVVIIEEEAFSLAGWRWSRAARRLGLPYAIQSAENLERSLPRLMKWAERSVLAHAHWVMARSPGAGERSVRHGASRDVVEVVPHGVDVVRANEERRRSGVVGFVGRLAPAKGVSDLLDVARRRPDLQFEFVGDGELRDVVSSAGTNVTYRGVLAADELNDFYASVAVLAVPSRTTPTWSEQFGRVIVEAQAHGAPVVAYDSGEIPWVAQETAVLVVPEGDVNQLTEALARCAVGEEGRQRGREGRTLVENRFTNAAAAAQIRRFVTSIVSR